MFIKFLVVGASGLIYLVAQSFRRSAPKQKKYIKKKFLRCPIFTAASPLNLPRITEENMLSQYFSSPPSGPIVITGPDGSGKTTILKRVMSGRSMTVYLDLRQNPVTSEDEFMFQFVESTGYLLPSTDLFYRWLLREKAPKENKISRVEVDRALLSVQNMLFDEKKNGWNNGYPLICISGMESLDRAEKIEGQGKRKS
jgi:hypothetical protein